MNICPRLIVSVVLGAVVGVGSVNSVHADADVTEDGVTLITQKIVTRAGGFPYKITTSGSYRLASNLVVSEVNTNGIDVLTDNVTLDLNGFAITGPVVCSGPPVTCSPPSRSVGVNTGEFIAAHDNIAVSNGVVQGFGDGIALFGSHCVVKSVRAVGNSGRGIATSGCLLLHNIASGNGGQGVFADTGSTLIGNMANSNGNSGFGRGFGIDCPSNLVGNTAVGNGTQNLATSGGCNIEHNLSP